MLKQVSFAALAMLLSGMVQAADYKILADQKADFSRFKTFRIDNVSITRVNGAKVKKANMDRLRAAVKEELIREGLTESPEAPDLVVIVKAGMNVVMHSQETQGMPYFNGSWQILPQEQPVPSGEPNEEKYGQASLQIDLRQAAGNAVVWRAVLEDVVRLPVSKETVSNSLKKVFEQYPPPIQPVAP